MHESRVSIRNGRFKTAMQWGGSGEPLVYLHGASGPMFGAAFLAELARHFTVFAPAHPGFGPSEGLEHLDDVIDLAIYYHDFLDALRIDKPHLVGHSLGGMLAAEVAALAPGRIDRLVLVAPVGLWIDTHPIPDFFAFNPQQRVDHALADPAGPLGKLLLARYSDAETGLELHKCMAAAGKFLWPIPDKGLKKRIHRIQQPTLLIWGANDRIVPPAYGEAFLTAIAGAQLLVLARSGHLPMLEEEDAFVAAVAQFLAPGRLTPG